MRKIFWGAGLILIMLMAAAATWWWLHRPAPPGVDAFRRLPAGFVAAWQADAAALRRSPLVRQALARAAAAKADPAYLDRLGRADLISGVILPGGRTVMAMEGPGLSFVSPGPETGAGPAATRLAELGPLPAGKDLWLVMDPKSPGPLSIGPIRGVTVELPSELLRSAERLSAYGNVGTLSLELGAEAEYASAADAARLASTLQGFLGLLKKLAVRHRNATADQALEMFWQSLEVKAEGNLLKVHAKLGEADVAKLLLLPGP